MSYCLSRIVIEIYLACWSPTLQQFLQWSNPKNNSPVTDREYTRKETTTATPAYSDGTFSIFLGPNKHTLTQIKDAVRDGLRAVKNAIEDGEDMAQA